MPITLQARRRWKPRGVRTWRRLCDPGLAETMQMVARMLGEEREFNEIGALGVEAQEMRIFGRIFTLRDWGCSLEADRHSEILGASMGFQMGSKGVTTPRVEERA